MTIQEIYSSLINLYSSDMRLHNLVINSNIIENGDILAIKENEGTKLVSLDDQGTALLLSEITVDRLEKNFQNLENELLEIQEMIEALINGKIPPRILAGLDIKLNCIDKGKRDNIHLELCHQGPNRIICRAELLREGQGINTNRIIPIPYFKTDKTLSLKFPEDSVYKKGSGKTYDISKCIPIGTQLKCPSLVSTANSCLEHLVTSKEGLDPDCEVELIPENRPLITQTSISTLVAQRSQTALVAEYKDKAITSDPFIVSNSENLGLTYGSEEINIPAIDMAEDTVIIPNGKFEALDALRELHHWKTKWERILPLHMRQILLLVSLTLQSFLTIPLVV